MTVVNAQIIRSATVCNIWLMWVDDFSFGERHLCVLDLLFYDYRDEQFCNQCRSHKESRKGCATIETDIASSDPEEVFTKKKHLKGPLKTQTTNKQIA